VAVEELVHTSQIDLPEQRLKNFKEEDDVRISQRDEPHLFISGFEPSQELKASQGRYTLGSFVKVPKKESSQSEYFISTVSYSDEWNAFTNFSHAMLQNDHDK
jgi:hypothetical protein